MPQNLEKSFGVPPLVYVLAAVLLWSTGGLFIKLTALNSYQISFWRSLLAAATVAVLTRHEGLRINAFVFLTSALYAGMLFFFVFATKLTTAANAIFLQYTAPIYILLFAPLLVGDKFHWRDLLTVLVCLGGMSLFFVGQIDVNSFQGNLAALISGICMGFYFLLLRHPQSQRINRAAAVIYGNVLLAILTIPYGITALPTMTGKDFFAVAFLGVFQIGVSYTLFTLGIARGTRPLDASIIGFIEPILNPVWVFLFVGEKPSNWAILGGLIIITVVTAHTISNARFKKTQPQANNFS